MDKYLEAAIDAARIEEADKVAQDNPFIASIRVYEIMA